MLTTLLVAVEDHNFLRRTLRGWLEVKFPECHVIEATSREEVLAVALTRVLHVILMSVGLQPTNDLDIVRQINAAAPVAAVVILTTYEDKAYQFEMIRAGASACISMLAIPPTELQATLAALLLFDQDALVGCGPEKVLIGSS